MFTLLYAMHLRGRGKRVMKDGKVEGESESGEGREGEEKREEGERRKVREVRGIEE